MKKQDIIPCTLAVAMIGAISMATAMAAKGPQLQARMPNVAQKDPGQFKRFLVKYKPSVKASARDERTAAMAVMNNVLASAQMRTRGKTVTAQHLRTTATGHQVIRLSGGIDAVQAQALIDQVKASDPAISSVTIDELMTHSDTITAPKTMAQPTAAPNDPLFARYQWNLNAADGANSGGDGGANRGGANVVAAWDLADGNDVVVAILDTGITAHPDVDSSMADAGYDFITDAMVSGRDNDNRAPGGWDLGDWTTGYPGAEACSPGWSSWHGTHVAATAGAEHTNNAIGMAGIAYNAKILPVRVMGHCGGYESDIADAIIWAAGGTVTGVPANQNPAKVINMSLGGSNACAADSPYQIAINQANELGASVVVSAGNHNGDSSTRRPSGCQGVIAVAANGITSKRAFYSGYGAGVPISAPGGGVYANDASSGSQVNDGFVWQAVNPSDTTPAPIDQIDPAADYGGKAGTSMSAPHVSGIIAMMHAARADAELPPLTQEEILEILQRTATPFTVIPPSSQPIGTGIVNAAAAVDKAMEPPCDPAVEECEPDAILLANRVPLANQSGNADGETLYSYEATAGSVLSIMSYGGSGDANMYVSFDEEPTTAAYDAKSTRAGNSETVRFTAPQTGTYYIKLVGARAYRNLTIVARQ